jgi:hypothetical protein
LAGGTGSGIIALGSLPNPPVRLATTGVVDAKGAGLSGSQAKRNKA